MEKLSTGFFALLFVIGCGGSTSGLGKKTDGLVCGNKLSGKPPVISRVFCDDDYVKNCRVKISGVDAESYNLFANCKSFPWSSWSFSDEDGVFTVLSLMKGEYVFSISPGDYESYSSEFVASKKVVINRDNQVVNIEVPVASMIFEFDLSAANLRDLFKRHEPGNYNLIGKIENDGGLKYIQWLYFKTTDCIAGKVTMGIDHLKSGAYKITFFLSPNKAASPDTELDRRVLGFIKFRISEKDIKAKRMKLKL